MKNKINIQLISISLLAILLTLTLTLGVVNTLLKEIAKDNLQTTAKILEDSGDFTKENKKNLPFSYEDLRITWIDSDGSILYDNDADESQMENHLERPEVKEALKKGSAFVIRRSDTIGKSTFYYAYLLKDNTVLRVAKTEDAALKLMKGILPLLALVVIFLFIVSTIIARVFSARLIRPIEELAHNMKEYPSSVAYKELAPFMKMIRDQHMELLKSAQLRQDFTANVSHELKTPLTAISGYAELMETGMIQGEEVKTYSQKIRENTSRLLALINDILRLFELDTEEQIEKLESFDLLELAEKCVDNLKISAQKHEVSLSCQGERTYITANRDMIYEVLCNLCDNGIRYNNPGGAVEVTVGAEEGIAFLRVKDNGIGIPGEHQGRIFERFYRVDKSRSRQTGGTGLGLAIVKHIVAIHHGKIQLNSEIGKGTEIKVSF